MVKHAFIALLTVATGCHAMPEFSAPTESELPDAGTPDATRDPAGPVSFGKELMDVCMAPASLTPVTFPAPVTIDTSNPLICTVCGPYCVIAGTTLTVNATLRATGTRPLVLLASNSIIVNQLIDVGSHRLPAESLGAGADPVACLAGAPPGTNGGGAGGSFAGSGGMGGAADGPGGVPASAATPFAPLRGGCRGQDGNGTGKGTGGHGGGAVYLVAGSRIDITGPGINAAGEGGTGGAVVSGVPSGGGAGGSGGMIGLDAPTITCTGLLLASGGGGGQGSGTSATGSTGLDPTGVNAAGGGTPAMRGSACGGNGGDGSSGLAAGAGASAGAPVCPGAGAGGGGGGAGIIKAPVTLAAGTPMSPSATP